MDKWIEGVRRVLARTPTGALAFSDVYEALVLEGIGPSPDPTRLLKGIRERGDLFRVIPLARGPWAAWREACKPGGDPLRAGRRSDDPWVLLLGCPERGFGPTEGLLQRIREGLVDWGRCLDDASVSGTARWARATREGTRAWEALVRPLASDA
jgi:hypothetical protein